MYQENVGKAHPLASSLSSERLAKRAGGHAGDPLIDANSTLWYGEISVGTPSETFTGQHKRFNTMNAYWNLPSHTVDFDTGSSDLFLPGVNCSSSCSGRKIYNVSESSTTKDLGKQFALKYGDNSTVSGEQYTDTVSIVGLAVRPLFQYVAVLSHF